MRTTVDRFGRVVLPKALRDRFGLAAGANVEIEEAGDHLALRAAEAAPPLAVKSGILLFTGVATGNLENAVTADRERRGSHVAGTPGG